MKDIVKVKATISGLTLIIDAAADWDSIRKNIADKFENQRSFWGKGDKCLTFSGKELSEEQQNDIIDIIESNTDLIVLCVKSDDREEEFRAAISKHRPEPEEPVKEKKKSKFPSLRRQNADNTKADQPTQLKTSVSKNDPKDDVHSNSMKLDTTSESYNASKQSFIFKGNLRSGQLVEAECSIIILGDVNAGAEVVSKGNVIIIGALKGNVRVGSEGNKNAFVIALEMNPIQIRIADYIAKSPDKKPKEIDKDAKIAFCSGENIYIENISREVFSEITLD